MNEYFQKRGMNEEEKKKFLGEAYNSAYKFAKKIFDQFPGLIKSVILFGSVYKGTVTKGSDIDLLVIFDDTKVKPMRRFIDYYNLTILKFIQEIDRRLHVNTVTLTTFWENVKAGEPVAINVLRSGVALIDTGYFEPLQILLREGRIRPTPEAIYNCLERVPGHMTRANSRLLATVIDLYWVALDSAHAALMAYGVVPPSPENVYDLLKKTFVEKGMLKKKYADFYREIWSTAKAIIHGEILKISGIDIDNYRNMADDFGGKMKELVKKKEKVL